MSLARRKLLAAAGGALAALGGCTARDPGSNSGPPGDRPTATARDPDPIDAAGEWPQFGADETHAGVSPAAGVPDAGRPYWQLRRIRSGPAVLADGRLFHYAELGADTGGRPTLTRTRAEPAGTAHPVDGEPHLVARDAREGRIRWSAPLDGPTAGWPAVADGRVLAASRTEFAAFDATDGSRLWTNVLDGVRLGDPTIAGEVVVVARHGVVDGRSGERLQEPQVRAYDLADGRRRWTVTAPKRATDLAVAGDTVVVVSGGYDGDGVAFALSLDDGGERWRTEVPGDFFAGPVVAGGTAYLSGSDGTLRALAVADGRERWHRDFQSRPGGFAAGAGTAFVVVRGTLFALAAGDGGVRWTAGHGGTGVDATPAVGDDTVYAGLGGRLLALDAGDGTERWYHGFPDTVVEGDMVVAGVEAQPAVVEGGVYVRAVDGLYAFGPA